MPMRCSIHALNILSLETARFWRFLTRLQLQVPFHPLPPGLLIDLQLPFASRVVVSFSLGRHVCGAIGVYCIECCV